MARMIDADALKQTFCAECNHSIKCDDCDIDYHFNHAPTVEPKHGHWDIVDDADWGELPKCSVCNKFVSHAVQVSLKGKQRNYEYCPNCGAKMDEVEDV